MNGRKRSSYVEGEKEGSTKSMGLDAEGLLLFQFDSNPSNQLQHAEISYVIPSIILIVKMNGMMKWSYEENRAGISMEVRENHKR